MNEIERDPAMLPLFEQVTRELSRPVNRDLHTLTHALMAQYGEAISAILFYGSCLRTHSTGEGLVDLYLLVDHYQDIHRTQLGQWANALLPPTVFLFTTATPGGTTLRAKCAILSVRDFEEGTHRWFQSYLWARFAQPSRLVFSRTTTVHRRVERAVCRAALRMISEALPVQAPLFNSDTFWTRALGLTYGTELRPENSDRPALITHQNQAYLAALLRAVAHIKGAGYAGSMTDELYINHTTSQQQLRQARRWRIRRIQGRLLNLVRLVKALFTVRGGVDYAIWKLERHWGEPIRQRERLRRYPLVFCWPLLWKLLKQRPRT
ncbi:hypothetical protein [Pseudomonas sp. TE3610]